jgi:tRNA(Ile)-lysidine synthase
MSRFGRPASTTLIPGEAMVWDGRFEIVAHEPGLRVVALAGRAARLAPADRAALAQVPAIARPSLPVVLERGGASRLCGLVPDPRVSVRDLAYERFAASIGDIPDEATAWRMAKARAIS